MYQIPHRSKSTSTVGRRAISAHWPSQSKGARSCVRDCAEERVELAPEASVHIRRRDVEVRVVHRAGRRAGRGAHILDKVTRSRRVALRC
jgi:hypothetical protein